MRINMPIDLSDSYSRRFWRFLECYFNIPLYCFLYLLSVFLYSFDQFHYCTIWFVCLLLVSYVFVCPYFSFKQVNWDKNLIYILLIYFSGYWFNVSCSLYGIILLFVYLWILFFFLHCLCNMFLFDYWFLDLLLFLLFQNIQIIWGGGCVW